MDTFQVVLEIFPICDYTCHLVISMHVLVISSLQKVADDKAMKAKKGGPKGKKDDGPAQNGETKTNEVWRGKTEKKKTCWCNIESETDKKITIFTPLLCQSVYTHTTPVFLHNHTACCNKYTSLSITHMHADTHTHTYKHTHTHRSTCLVRLSVCPPSETPLPPWCQWEGRVRLSELRVCSSVSNRVRVLLH